MPHSILSSANTNRLSCHSKLFCRFRQSRNLAACMTLLWRPLLILGGTAMISYGLPVQAEGRTALSFELNESERFEQSEHSATTTVKSYAASPGSLTQFQATAPKPEHLAAEAVNQTDPIPARWWNQGSNSPIAVAIGNAEGTRQPDGAKTAAYYWHQDPGNGADNFGTFSYQHFPAVRTQAVRAEANAIAKREVAAAQQLPELADQAQMQRLFGFYQQLQRQAQTSGLVLTPLEILNGLDLINQSEAAGLSPGGYVDHLAQMRNLEEDSEEQIKEARSWSYWHPERKAWDAPGLGNGYSYIRRDQERRFEAVKRAAEAYIPDGKAWVAQMPEGAGGSEVAIATSQSQGQTTLRATVASAVQADSLSFELGRKIALAAVER